MEKRSLGEREIRGALPALPDLLLCLVNVRTGGLMPLYCSWVGGTFDLQLTSPYRSTYNCLSRTAPGIMLCVLLRR